MCWSTGVSSVAIQFYLCVYFNGDMRGTQFQQGFSNGSLRGVLKQVYVRVWHSDNLDTFIVFGAIQIKWN